MVYLPSWMVDFYGINVGKYTRPIHKSYGSVMKNSWSYSNISPTFKFLKATKSLWKGFLYENISGYGEKLYNKESFS